MYTLSNLVRSELIDVSKQVLVTRYLDAKAREK